MGEITLKELGRGRSKWYRPNFPDGHDVCVAKPIKAVKEFIRARTFLNVHDERAILPFIQNMSKGWGESGVQPSMFVTNMRSMTQSFGSGLPMASRLPPILVS